jgi:hypothetical protein
MIRKIRNAEDDDDAPLLLVAICKLSKMKRDCCYSSKKLTIIISSIVLLFGSVLHLLSMRDHHGPNFLFFQGQVLDLYEYLVGKP